MRRAETDEHRQKRSSYESFYRRGLCRASVFRWDEELGWTACPSDSFDHEVNGWKGHFVTDAEGFRTDPARPPANPLAADARVLLIGDSFAFGMGAHDDETIDFFLRALAPGIVLKNVSAPGWSPEQYVAAYRRYARAFRPTHVYVLLTHVNDLVILDNATAYNVFKPTVQLRSGKPTRIVPPSELARFKPRRSSLVWSTRLGYLVSAALEPRYLQLLCGLREPYGMPPEYEKERLQLYSASRNARGQFDTIWKRFDFLMRTIGDEARGDHARLSLVILPLGGMREIVERRKALGALPSTFELTPASDYSVDVMLGRVAESAARHGVPLLDPTPEFEAAKARGLSPNSAESHYGPVGNRLVAEAILRHLHSNP